MSDKIITNEYNIKVLLTDYQKLMERKASSIENILLPYLNDNKLNNLINSEFNPSKTAQYGLNFITKDDEISLANLYKENQNQTNNDIIAIFKFIFILIRQERDGIEDHLLIDFLINIFMQKYNIGSLSNLLI